MNRIVDGWMDGLMMNEWKKVWMHKRMKKMGGLIYEWMDECINEVMAEVMNELMGLMDG